MLGCMSNLEVIQVILTSLLLFSKITSNSKDIVEEWQTVCLMGFHGLPTVAPSLWLFQAPIATMLYFRPQYIMLICNTQDIFVVKGCYCQR